MGIRGLASSICNRSPYCLPYQLQNTDLIVDGTNLVFNIHRRAGLHCVYGGEYPSYSRAVENFFTALKRARVNPVLIFDGQLHKEFCQSALHRYRKCKLDRSINLLHEQNGEDKEFASLFLDDVLRRAGNGNKCNVEMHQAYGDVNRLVVSMANHRKCPVLSRNSDFFIMDAKFGFIYFDSLVWKPTTNDRDHHLENYSHLKCNIFYFESYYKAELSDINQNVFPLFGVLFGKNFLYCDALDKLLSELINKPINRDQKNFRYRRQSGAYEHLTPRLSKALEWIKNKTRSSVIQEVSQAMFSRPTVDEKAVFCPECDVMSSESKFAEFLHHACQFYEASTGSEWDRDKDLTSTFAIPSWCLEAFERFRFPAVLLEMIHTGRITLWITIEDFASPSVFECCSWLRTIVYKSCMNRRLTKDESTFKIIEYVRDCNGEVSGNDLIFRRKYDLVQWPFLDDFVELKTRDKISWIYDVLRLSKATVEHLKTVPVQLKGFLLSLKLWYQCTTKPKDKCLYAFVLCSYGLLLRNCTRRWWLRSNFYIENAYERQNVVNSIIAFEQTVNSKTVETDQKALQNVVHGFNEWQAVVQGLEWLNFVTCQPFGQQVVTVEDIFCGSICYNLAKPAVNKSASRPDSEKFLKSNLEKVLDQENVSFCYTKYEKLITSLLFAA